MKKINFHQRIILILIQTFFLTNCALVQADNFLITEIKLRAAGTLAPSTYIGVEQFKNIFALKAEQGLEQKLAKIHKAYDGIADWGIYEGVQLRKYTYDENGNKIGLVWFSDIDDINKILDVLSITARTKVCDLGSAVGHVCTVFAARGAQVVGYEIGEDMVVFANEILAEKLEGVIDKNKIRFEATNFLEKDLSDFDILFHYWHGLMSEYNQEFKEKLVKELKPGGFLIVYLGGEDENHFPELTEATFLPGYEKIRHFAKIYTKPVNSEYEKDEEILRVQSSNMPLPSGMNSEAYKLYKKAGKEGWGMSGKGTYSAANPRFRQWLVEQIGSGKKVLSLGCGRGELEIELQKAGNEVVAVDRVPEMVEAARKRGLEKVILADANNLPEGLKQGNFDVVLFSESMGNVNIEAALAQAQLALKQDGKLIITTPAPDKDRCIDEKEKQLYAKLSKTKLVKLISSAGFEVLRAEESFWLSYPPEPVLPGFVIYIEAKRHNQLYSLKKDVLENRLMNRFSEIESRFDLFRAVPLAHSMSKFLSVDDELIDTAIMEIEEKGKNYITEQGIKILEEFNTQRINADFEKVHTWTELINMKTKGDYDFRQLLSHLVGTAQMYFDILKQYELKDKTNIEKFKEYFEKMWVVLRAIDIEAREFEELIQELEQRNIFLEFDQLVNLQAVERAI